jgi:Kinesin motor domain
MHPKGATVIDLSKAGDIGAILQQGLAKRTTGSTDQNAKSSRSHAIFTLLIQSRPKGSTAPMTTSRINFVDLAGSERAAITNTKDKAAADLAAQGAAIKQSLLVLTQIISLLSQQSAKALAEAMLKCRSSATALLLRDSLFGASTVSLICHIKPGQDCQVSTSETLRVAAAARAIKATVSPELQAKAIAIIDKKLRRLQAQRDLVLAGGSGAPAVIAAHLTAASSSAALLAPRAPIGSGSVVDDSRSLDDGDNSSLDGEGSVLDDSSLLESSSIVGDESFSSLDASFDGGAGS